MIVSRCESCGSNNVINKKIDIDYMGKRIKKVPAFVCQECGEELILSDVLERVESIINKGKDVYY